MTIVRNIVFFMMAVSLYGMENGDEIFFNNAYEQQSAREKRDQIWDSIVESTFDGIMPTTEGPGFFGTLNLMLPSFLSQAFSNNGDVMQPGRCKHIHTHGTAAKIRFVPVRNHPYTGIFWHGSEYGILRLSLAVPAEANKYLPGIAMKFFQDGAPSLNIMAMVSLDGQTSPNLFAHDFSTVLLPQQPSLKSWATDKAFTVALEHLGQENANPRSLSSEHLAQEDNLLEGHKSPHAIIFRPTEQACSLMRFTNTTDDYRVVLEGRGAYLRLFLVYARDADTMEETYLGDIETLSRFYASAFGDRLFFKHPHAHQNGH